MYRRAIEVLKRQPKWRLAVAVLIIVAATVWLSRGRRAAPDIATFEARRGPLQISVLEGGTMQAINSQEIKCEVRVGYQGAKILKIVDEGYQVTDEDVKSGKVLVELDSSDLQKQQVQQEIVFQTAAAALADARQGYDIQVIQNTSDILAAEQKARFARMDFQKFLGNTAADSIIEQLGLNEDSDDDDATPSVPTAPPVAAEQTNGAVTASHSNAVLVASLDISSALFSATNGPATNTSVLGLENAARASSIDFSVFTNMSRLGDGEGKQKYRKLEDDLQVAQKEANQSQTTLEGTRRLHAKGFVTRTDLQRDEIAYENSRLKVQTADTARNLFLKYELLKTSEETLSKYCEAVRELQRARKAAIAKLAQADAKLKSATAQFNVQYRQRRDLETQIDKCVIKAEKPGLVIYGRAGDDMVFYGAEERIREGASVRERQTILTIPDLSKMGVKVKVHETYVKKVHVGQPVRITVDAFPDKMLEGEVTKVGVLPDSGNRWMNPDMKVYLTTIAVNGTNDWLKPGMTARVEILVDRLEDAVYVPLQAVVPESGKFACYVVNGSRAPERREVEVGQFNDEFIEVTKGIAEGDEVMLNPPRAVAAAADEKDKNGGTNGAVHPVPVHSMPGTNVPRSLPADSTRQSKPAHDGVSGAPATPRAAS